MDEPVGRSIEGTPWPEARGPHLPDPLVRGVRATPRISWAWIAVALVAGVGHALYAGIVLSDVSVAFLAVLAVVPAVGPSLMGAALFARHRDAWSTHRGLVVSIALLSLGTIMELVPAVVWSVDQAVDPFADESTLSLVLRLLALSAAGILQVVGLVGLARGLRGARVRGRSGPSRNWTAAIWAVAILVAAGSVYGNVVVMFAPAGSAPWLIGYLVVSSVISGAIMVAWAYVITVALGGAAAGERPIGAWRLASVGGLAVLAGAAIQIGSFVVLATLDPSSDGGVLWGISIAGRASLAIGYLALMAAFVNGLPSSDGTEEAELPAARPWDQSDLDDDDGPLDHATLVDFGERPIR